MGNEFIDILLEVNKAVKTLHFYPEGHPNLATVISGGHGVITGVIAEKGEFNLKVEKKNILINDQPQPMTNPAVANIAKLFVLRKIKALQFLKSITQSDYSVFLSVLKLEPEDLFAKGGVESVFARGNVRGILLNEMTFEQLVDMQEKQDQTVEEELEEIEVSAEDAVKPDDAESSSSEEEIDPDSLAGLIKRIDAETDHMRYTDLSVRIKEKTDVLLKEKNYAEVFTALKQFFKHTLAQYAADTTIRETAATNVKALLTTEMVGYLVERLSEPADPNKSLIQHIFRHPGEEAINFLFEHLINTHSATIRRTIFNVLVRQGESVRAEVEKRLDDERWFVTRQMVSLLASLGAESSIERILKIYGHKDIRVKKEVLKTLSRVPLAGSAELLRTALKETDPGLKGQAIISLGMIRDEGSVEQLGDLANKGAEDAEMRKEAIKALGIIKTKTAIPQLAKLLAKKSWFGKETSEEFKILAVTSLAKIGGDEAMEIIMAAYKDSSGRLYNTCKRIIEGGKE
ncbi:MAG: HEAT repeat domain-containing protein [Deltaproteobacteria bacterium]|nr:HEAT repeat domain-containing protein [Deltaproteobacteria bacterium]